MITNVGNFGASSQKEINETFVLFRFDSPTIQCHSGLYVAHLSTWFHCQKERFLLTLKSYVRRHGRSVGFGRNRKWKAYAHTTVPATLISGVRWHRSAISDSNDALPLGALEFEHSNSYSGHRVRRDALTTAAGKPGAFYLRKRVRRDALPTTAGEPEFLNYPFHPMMSRLSA